MSNIKTITLSFNVMTYLINSFIPYAAYLHGERPLIIYLMYSDNLLIDSDVMEIGISSTTIAIEIVNSIRLTITSLVNLATLTT